MSSDGGGGETGGEGGQRVREEGGLGIVQGSCCLETPRMFILKEK